MFDKGARGRRNYRVAPYASTVSERTMSRHRNGIPFPKLQLVQQIDTPMVLAVASEAFAAMQATTKVKNEAFSLRTMLSLHRGRGSFTPWNNDADLLCRCTAADKNNDMAISRTSRPQDLCPLGNVRPGPCTLL